MRVMRVLGRVQDWRAARLEQAQQRSVDAWMANPHTRACSQSYREQEQTARECQELARAREDAPRGGERDGMQ